MEGWSKRMIRAFLGPRRLWWFLTDWTTEIRFNVKCSHCGQQIVIESRGFRYPRTLPHNPVCEYRRGLNYEFPALWWLIWGCWRLRSYAYCAWFFSRWRFRVRYNWGVGVPAECLDGKHDWGDEPIAIYEDGNMRNVTGQCRRCGFCHRWETSA